MLVVVSSMLFGGVVPDLPRRGRCCRRGRSRRGCNASTSHKTSPSLRAARGQVHDEAAVRPRVIGGCRRSEPRAGQDQGGRPATPSRIKRGCSPQLHRSGDPRPGAMMPRRPPSGLRGRRYLSVEARNPGPCRAAAAPLASVPAPPGTPTPRRACDVWCTDEHRGRWRRSAATQQHGREAKQRQRSDMASSSPPLWSLGGDG